MDMDAAKTDELIAEAVRALPYRRPSAGFAARIMAQVAVTRRELCWADYALKAAEMTVAAWTAALCWGCVRLVSTRLPEIAAFFMQPGGVSAAVKLLAARAALLGVKLAAAVSLAADLAAAAAGFPGYYEIGAAVVLSTAALAALSARTAAARI
ncbi:MAG TPA: hypothetical protein PKI19_10770 [Elusimicrobiales bacterium]|nr:hypothetical protein [Elusimicrobiales bacterium]